MKNRFGLAGLLASTIIAGALAVPTPAAHAQSVDEQIKMLVEQMKAMQTQIEALQKQQAETKQAAQQRADVKIEAKGAPQISGPGFKFKVRGRLQADVGQVGGADKFGDNRLGTTTEIRRARIGVEGAIAGFGYKLEADFADNNVSVADALISWDGPVKVAAGHLHPTFSMEQQTSSRFSVFMERGGFTSTFDLGRMTGVRVDKEGEGYALSAGIFSDGGFSGDSSASGYAVSARGVLNPKFGNTQTHLGGWVMYRDNGAQGGRYRNRPLIHTTDVRFIDSGALDTTSDMLFGVEAAAISGPFYVSGEWAWLNADLAAPRGPGLDSSYSANGGYIHAGYFLTGESRGYKAGEGVFDRTKPSRPLSKGGNGAWAVNFGLDYTDLTDNGAGVAGGKQTGYLANVMWIPESYLRFIAQYGYIDVSGRTLGGVAVDNVSTFGLRAQVDW